MHLKVGQSSFLMYSGAIYFGYTKRHISKLLLQFGKNSEYDDLGALVVPLADLCYEELSDDEIAALLVHRHELDHAKCFFESPLGLLLFRSYWSLIGTLNWLFQEFFIPGELGDESLSRPKFLEWVENDAASWIEARLQSGRLRHPLLPSERSPEFNETLNRLLEYVKYEAIGEISVLVKFIDAILKRNDTMTLGDFANLANRAFDRLSMRCEAPNRSQWTTDAPDTPLHPEGDSILSTEELLEYSALQSERHTLETLRAPEHAVRRWRESYEEDPYLAGFRLEARSKQPPDLLLLLARLALRSPIDLVVGTEGEMLVEAHHPTWRFRYHYFTIGDRRDCPRTGLSYHERVAAFTQCLGFTAIESSLCDLSIVPQPRVSDLNADVAEIEIFGPSMLRDRDSLDAQDRLFDPMRAVADLSEAFRHGLAKAARGELDTNYPLVPLHYYRDICSFNKLRGKDDVSAIFTAHALTASSLLQLSLLFGGPHDAVIPPLDTALFQRIIAAGISDIGAVKRLYSMKAMAEAIFGKPFAASLKWQM